MNKKLLVTAVGLVLAFVCEMRVQAQTAKASFIRMAPVHEYLMNRDAEVALARSAAPAAISAQASVLVLTDHGWETAEKGTNGFVCMVERAWTSSIDFSRVWDPKMRGADCLNAAAAQTILPLIFKLTQMALAGENTQQRIAGIQSAFAAHEIPPLQPGAIGYMMSKGAYITDSTPHNFPHMMVFVATRATDSAWGAWLKGVPLGSCS
ncbi:MAG: hypothetical protein ACRD2D_11780, partial [Terriglobales bacterium]